jgi:hypothetical protein
VHCVPTKVESAVPGVIKLNEGECRRVWGNLQVDRFDFAILQVARSGQRDDDRHGRGGSGASTFSNSFSTSRSRMSLGRFPTYTTLPAARAIELAIARRNAEATKIKG